MNDIVLLFCENGPSLAPKWRRLARHYRWHARAGRVSVVWFRVIAPLMLASLMSDFAHDGQWHVAVLYAVLVYVGAYVVAPTCQKARTLDLQAATRCEENASYLAAGLLPPEFSSALHEYIERHRVAP